MTKSIITSTFLTFVCLFNLQAFAQSANCDELKKENEYLKKALSILTPVKTVTTDKIDFNISKCEGNIKQQTVELTVVVTNHGPHSELSLRKAVAVDAEGNEFQTYQIKIGSGSSINKIYTDVPVKTTFKFEKVLPSVKLLKIIAIEFTGNNGGFEYKDIAVTWH